MHKTNENSYQLPRVNLSQSFTYLLRTLGNTQTYTYIYTHNFV